jgi:CBS domain-containing protein
VLIRELMTADVVTVTPATPLKQPAELLASRRISGVPVVDADGRVVGVFSEGDVLVQERGAPRPHTELLRLVFDPDAAWREKVGARTVAEAMSSPPICIGPDRPVHAAAERMLADGVNRPQAMTSLVSKVPGVVSVVSHVATEVGGSPARAR